MDRPIPHIKITVEYDGKQAEEYCSHFIDGISFLCHCEAAIRSGANMTEPIDIRTTEFQKSNLDKLLDLNQKINGGSNGNNI